MAAVAASKTGRGVIRTDGKKTGSILLAQLGLLFIICIIVQNT